MEKYVIKDGYKFEIIEERDKLGIEINQSNKVQLNEMLIKEKQNDFTYLSKFFPLSWIKKDYIMD